MATECNGLEHQAFGGMPQALFDGLAASNGGRFAAERSAALDQREAEIEPPTERFGAGKRTALPFVFDRGCCAPAAQQRCARRTFVFPGPREFSLQD